MDVLLERDLRHIEESWLLLPFSLTHVDTIAGQKLYSSKKLQDEAIEIFTKQKFFTPVIEKVKNLIERQIIMPCFASKGLISTLKDKIFSKNKEHSIDQYTVGYFSSEKNKVFVIIEGKSISSLDSLLKSSVSKVAFHELQHYCAYNLQNKFLTINEQSINAFFTEFYKSFFGVDVSEADIQKITKYIFTTYELNKMVNINFLNQYATMIDYSLSHLIVSNHERESRIIDMMSTLKIFLQDGMSFINLLKQREQNATSVFSSLIHSYKKINVNKPTTIAIQELIYPSEIIAIESEYNPSPSHYKSIEAI